MQEDEKAVASDGFSGEVEHMLNGSRISGGIPFHRDEVRAGRENQVGGAASSMYSFGESLDGGLKRISLITTWAFAVGGAQNKTNSHNAMAAKLAHFPAPFLVLKKNAIVTVNHPRAVLPLDRSN